MTKLRARIATPCPGIWVVSCGFAGRRSLWSSQAPSHPEALQLAHLMLRDLDRQLMDQVHESRATRRSAAPSCKSPERLMSYKKCPACRFGLVSHELTDPQCLENPTRYTMEPTA